MAAKKDSKGSVKTSTTKPAAKASSGKKAAPKKGKSSGK